MTSIIVPKGPINLAGLLYKPEGAFEGAKLPGLVIVHPGGGVKEQTASTYASKLAQEGFVTIAFDASHQGESGGLPHFLEDPQARVSDISAVVDYLQGMQDVDEHKIGVFGICAGSGYSISAARSDHRIKSLAVASALDIGDATRSTMEGLQMRQTLEDLAAVLTAEATGAEAEYIPYVPPMTENSPAETKEVLDYYLGPRGRHPNAQNKMLKRSLGLILGFDALALVPEIYSTPTHLFYGDKAYTIAQSHRLEKILGDYVESTVIKGANHMALYDVPGYVNQVVAGAAAFHKKHLKA